MKTANKIDFNEYCKVNSVNMNDASEILNALNAFNSLQATSTVDLKAISASELVEYVRYDVIELSNIVSEVNDKVFIEALTMINDRKNKLETSLKKLYYARDRVSAKIREVKTTLGKTTITDYSTDSNTTKQEVATSNNNIIPRLKDSEYSSRRDVAVKLIKTAIANNSKLTVAQVVNEMSKYFALTETQVKRQPSALKQICKDMKVIYSDIFTK